MAWRKKPGGVAALPPIEGHSEKTLPVATSATVVTGYRIWEVGTYVPFDGYWIMNGRGGSMYDQRPGQPVTPYQRIVAACGYVGAPDYVQESMRLPHAAPGAICHCGIYAYKRRVQVTVRIGCPYVAGEVSMWGRIIEHEVGYRAEFAYPKSLVLVDGGPRAQHIAVALGLAYGVPCEVWDG